MTGTQLDHRRTPMNPILRQSCKGFTLIEIVIVLAVVAALAGLLLTVRSGAPPAAAPPPDIVVPSPEFVAIDRALESLPLGNIAFSVSTVMILNRAEDVHLLLSPSMSIEELEKRLVETLRRETQVEGMQIRIAPRMEARLSGTNFSILGLTPEVQPVAWNQPTEWRWEVRPTEPGSQALHLTLTALLQIEGKDSMRAIRTFDRDIQVQVTWPQRISGFVAENWQWLWTTVAAPIALWVWNKRRKKQRGIGF
jgi:prepilin-type N-terminal cleavage/methylation domain-containing protein